MYEIFEHTADLGLRARAVTLRELCEESALGLMEIITGDLAQLRTVDALRFIVQGRDPALLLLDWLAELLHVFATRRMLFARFEVDVSDVPNGLSALAHGEPYDPARHVLAHEVKAITYHDLEVRQSCGGWDATMVVDI